MRVKRQGMLGDPMILSILTMLDVERQGKELKGREGRNSRWMGWKESGETRSGR